MRPFNALWSGILENFWYFNNGITLICDTITKNLSWRPANKLGVFTCDGVNIVNGAQTVGTIGTLLASSDESEVEDEKDPRMWVQVRIISLKKKLRPISVARSLDANLQNAVGNREFAAMDPQQHRLATEFALDRRRYVYKSGEPDPKGDEGCSIVEATQSLSCTVSVDLAVQVKREIGLMWADTTASPYTDLFNNDTQSLYVWKAVLVMRSVDAELYRLRSSDLPRTDLVAVHLSRVILFMVFQDPAMKRGLKDHTGGEKNSRQSPNWQLPQSLKKLCDTSKKIIRTNTRPTSRKTKTNARTWQKQSLEATNPSPTLNSGAFSSGLTELNPVDLFWA